jgi:hypothetical protein
LQTCLDVMPTIPAMTTEAERECYYRLARDGARYGEVVELGAWLGASSAWIAAGIRDSGMKCKAKVFDRFESKPNHITKVKAFYDKHGIDRAPVGPCMQAFKDNLGPLLQYAEPTKCEIGGLKWLGGPVSVLICDAPKRVREISSVLNTFRKALQPGSMMAWQDFCHFPSYEIPACLYRIRKHLEFSEAVVPGTTMVFRIKSQWKAEEVSPNALSLHVWSVDEIFEAWDYWRECVDPSKEALFECGLPMFLCDLGHGDLAARELGSIYERASGSIIKKWRYLKETRSDFLTRYKPLFDYLASQGAL